MTHSCVTISALKDLRPPIKMTFAQPANGQHAAHPLSLPPLNTLARTQDSSEDGDADEFAPALPKRRTEAHHRDDHASMGTARACQITSTAA